jgi:hypothetical protein
MNTRRFSAPGFLCAAAAVAWGVGIIVAAYTVPVYNCAGDCPAGSTTLIGENGSDVLPVVAAPLVAAVLAFVLLHVVCRFGSGWARVGAIVMACVAWAITALGALTIGIAILPLAALLTAAVVKTEPSGRRGPPAEQAWPSG